MPTQSKLLSKMPEITLRPSARGYKNRYYGMFRNEWKYFISEWEAQALAARLSVLMQKDPHVQGGMYTIRSLYFDDFFDSGYNEKIAGVNYRKKYRIRVYNCSDETIKLERKIKISNYIHKDSASLTRDEYDRIIAGDYGFLLHHPQQLCQEFYFESVANVLRPKVIVDYDREPFIMDEGEVRITFDRNVRGALMTGDIFDPALPAYNVLPPDQTVLEVKFTEYLPTEISQILPPDGDEFSAISKYTLCYERLQHRTDPMFSLTRSERSW